MNPNFADFVQRMLPARPDGSLVCLVNEAGEMYAVFDLILSQTDAESRAGRCGRLLPECSDLFSTGDTFGTITVRGFLRLLEEPEDFDWSRAKYVNLGENGAAYTLCGLPRLSRHAWESAS